MTIRAHLAVCSIIAAGFATPLLASDDYIRDAAERVKAADWNTMEVVTVTLDEHSFTPSELRFKAGKAYKLQLKNIGKKDHYFTAEKFFRAVAWRKAMVDKHAEVKAPYFTAFEPLRNGGQIDLYFVPITKASYEVICTIEDHQQQGMSGTLVIE